MSSTTLTVEEKEALLKKLSLACYHIDKQAQKYVPAIDMIADVQEILHTLVGYSNMDVEISGLHQILSALYVLKVEDDAYSETSNQPPPRLKGWVLSKMVEITKSIAFRMGYSVLTDHTYSPKELKFYNRKEWPNDGFVVFHRVPEYALAP